MKNSFKNTFLLEKKYLSLARVSLKWNKINFYYSKNQFPRAEIRFLLQKLLLPSFKIFNRALNKAILFLLDRKFVSTSRNEEFAKKTFPLGGFHWLPRLSLPGISHKWKKRFFTSLKSSLC